MHAVIAAFTSSVQMILPPARRSTSGEGWYFFGAAMRNSKSSLPAAHTQLVGTLQPPSPTKVTILPWIGPRSSW